MSTSNDNVVLGTPGRPESSQPTNNDPRNPWLAGLLGLVLPPIGFAYIGWPLTVVLLYVGAALLLAAIGWLGLVQSVPGIIFVFVEFLTLTIFMTWYCAVAANRTRRTYRKQWFNRWYFYVLFELIVGAPFGYAMAHRDSFFGFQLYRVPSRAMEPTIHSGEFIVADTRPATIANLKSGDLAVLVFPDSGSVHFIKRIVAGPGMHVQISTNGLLVDGQLQPRTGTQGDDTLQARFMRYTDVTLGPEQYYVMGDNRANSIDSRTNGPVDRDDFRGKPTAVYFSTQFDRIGPIQ